MKLHDVKTIDDLSDLLDVDKSKLTYYAYIISGKKKYSKFTIKKKGGGKRVILSPQKGLKDIQRKLLAELDPYYKPRNSIHGYIKGKSIVTNAAVHKNQRWLARLDIKSFYPSIHTGRVIGVFRSEPFKLPKDIAVILAKLCTYGNQLPQGAPTSPILSNLVARSLDTRLSALGREYKCYFTRYADDIFFSTNQRRFPVEIITHDEDEGIFVGSAVQEIFDKEDFKLNISKAMLKDKSMRQIVTGIVVNEIPNVPREYIREIRAMLYSWKQHGLTKAEKFWRETQDSRNRVGDYDPRFRFVLRGKLAHVAAVKGRGDPVYLKYAKKLASLDPDYTVDPKTITSSIASEINVFVEGKTDAIHLDAALHHFHSNGQLGHLKLDFPTNKQGDGDDALAKLCHSLSSSPQKKMSICLFDADNAKYISSMKGSASQYKDHGNNVFSMVLPRPSFREIDTYCIEHFYKDEDLLRKDKNGRRLYLRTEFDQQLGVHVSETGVVCLYPKKNSLIVDDGVVDTNKKEKVVLSKSLFSEYVRGGIAPYDAIDFSEFERIFEIISQIQSAYLE